MNAARAVPGDGDVSVQVDEYGVTFRLESTPPEHRLLAEAVREAGVPEEVDVQLQVTSAVPAATSLGTSASVCVGVIAALDALGGRIRPADELARAAHRVETVRLRRSLDDRLAHVAYGFPHDSSAVHDDVIAALEREGSSSPRLERLRRLAAEAATALESADLERYGRALSAATEGQAALHPALISDAAHELIDLARSLGAFGWKVNGAGGAGGSVSILCPTPTDREHVLDEARSLGHTALDLSLSPVGATLRDED